MNFLFDTSIDVNRRQFYVLAMGSCIGNLAGFMERNNDFLWNLYVTYGRRKFHWN